MREVGRGVILLMRIGSRSGSKGQGDGVGVSGRGDGDGLGLGSSAVGLCESVEGCAGGGFGYWVLMINKYVIC